MPDDEREEKYKAIMSAVTVAEIQEEPDTVPRYKDAPGSGTYTMQRQRSAQGEKVKTISAVVVRSKATTEKPQAWMLVAHILLGERVKK